MHYLVRTRKTKSLQFAIVWMNDGIFVYFSGLLVLISDTAQVYEVMCIIIINKIKIICNAIQEHFVLSSLDKLQPNYCY